MSYPWECDCDERAARQYQAYDYESEEEADSANRITTWILVGVVVVIVIASLVMAIQGIFRPPVP